MYCKNCNKHLSKGYFKRHLKTKKHLKINSYNFNSNELNINLGEDVDNIIKGFLFDLERDDRVEEHKLKFVDCFESINVNGVIKDIENSDINMDDFENGRFYGLDDIDLCEWIRMDDFGCSYRQYSNYKFENEYECWLDELENDERDEDDLDRRFEVDVIKEDWRIMEKEHDKMNDYLDKRFIDYEGYGEIRSFCIEEGLY